MPFTDPMADGPAIQAAGLRALKAGQTMDRTLGMVRQFRNATTGPRWFSWAITIRYTSMASIVFWPTPKPPASTA